VCAALGVELRAARLYPERGGVEAMLIPRPKGSFRVVVDPTPPRGWSNVPEPLRSTVTRHRFRFRVAHEIAHMLFYQGVGSDRPPRRVGAVGSAHEEYFADTFAAALLVDAREAVSTAFDVVRLHRRFDVSLEVASRAYASEHPGSRLTLWHSTPSGQLSIQWTNETQMPAGRAPSSLGDLQTIVARKRAAGESASATVLLTRGQALVLQE